MVTVYGLPLNAPAATSGDAGNGYNMVLGCTQEGRRIVSANLSRTTKSPPRNRGGLFVVHGRKSECASFSRCVDGQTEGDRNHSPGFMSFECLTDTAGNWSCFVATGTVQREYIKLVEGNGARTQMISAFFSPFFPL